MSGTLAMKYRSIVVAVAPVVLAVALLWHPQFEVQSAAALVALMPLAYRMWRQPAPRRDLHPEGAPAT